MNRRLSSRTNSIKYKEDTTMNYKTNFTIIGLAQRQERQLVKIRSMKNLFNETSVDNTSVAGDDDASSDTFSSHHEDDKITTKNEKIHSLSSSPEVQNDNNSSSSSYEGSKEQQGPVQVEQKMIRRKIHDLYGSEIYDTPLFQNTSIDDDEDIDDEERPIDEGGSLYVEFGEKTAGKKKKTTCSSDSSSNSSNHSDNESNNDGEDNHFILHVIDCVNKESQTNQKNSLINMLDDTIQRTRSNRRLAPTRKNSRNNLSRLNTDINNDNSTRQQQSPKSPRNGSGRRQRSNSIIKLMDESFTNRFESLKKRQQEAEQQEEEQKRRNELQEVEEQIQDIDSQHKQKMIQLQCSVEKHEDIMNNLIENYISVINDNKRRLCKQVDRRLSLIDRRLSNSSGQSTQSSSYNSNTTKATNSLNSNSSNSNMEEEVRKFIEWFDDNSSTNATCIQLQQMYQEKKESVNEQQQRRQQQKPRRNSFLGNTTTTTTTSLGTISSNKPPPTTTLTTNGLRRRSSMPSLLPASDYKLRNELKKELTTLQMQHEKQHDNHHNHNWW